MSLLTIELLGHQQITLAGRPLDLRVRKELALLAYLAIEQTHRHSRESILGLLWPDVSEDAARNNLRVVLAGLRRMLGEVGDAFLHADRQQVQFLPESDHTLDVLVFRRLLAGVQTHDHAAIEDCDTCLARMAEAATLYHGDFLAGFSLSDSASFEEWATVQREQLHQQQLEALEVLTTACERHGDYATQCRYARRQIELEPWREHAHAQLMRGLWASGQRGAALEQYQACRRILEAELGLEPSPELTALYEQLRAGESSELSVLSAELPASDLGTQKSTLKTQHSHNLPTQPTSFVGRAAEIEQLGAWLAEPPHRLVTLLGPGGIGKTRLALEVAAVALDRFADGAWIVDLASLEDPALVPQAIAAALGLQNASEQPASELLSAALRPKQLLLLLDSCEHLVAACRPLAEQLLRDCPSLTLLATSREMLHIAGEMVWQVSPLATPDSAESDPGQLLSYEGIRLFVERARAASAGFALTARNAPAVLQICRQLDSMPLALELAAARARHMPVETIAARLDDRFSLLTGGSYSEPRLRAALDWSYALLGETERACFRRLAVFAGGFTLEAAEDVASEWNTEHEELSSDRGDAQFSIVELLAQLVDKSLVVAEQRPEGLRYRLLETMRAYAREQLRASGEAEPVGARHMAYFLRLAEQAEAQLVGDDQIAWLDLLAAEHANLRAAVDWATERGGIIAALRLVTALRYFWRVRGYYAEGIELLRGLLTNPGVLGNTQVRARALNAAGYLEFVRGQQAQARELLEAALAIGRALADAPAIAFALRYLSALANAGRAYADARAYGEESLALYRSLGATNDIAGSSMYLGDIALAQGDDDRAEALYAESAAILRMRQNSIALPYPLRHLGYLALRRGRPDQAAALCAESLRLNLAISDQQGVAACLVGLAASAAATGQFERAARLLGHAEGLLEALHTRLLPYDRMQHERVRHAIGQRLGEAALADACAAGRAVPIEQLLAEAERSATPPEQPLATPDTDRSWPGAQEQPAGADLASPTARTSPPAANHNLPTMLTPLIGRESELRGLSELLRRPETRLLTIVGAGGMGKTRLALELARAGMAAFADGVYYVALAPLASTDALVSAIIRALDLTVQGSDLTAVLLQTLRDKQILLVLDNFEHVLHGAGLVIEILQAAERLQIVATSREPLNIHGEQRYLVQGMAYEPDAANADLANLAAVRMFVQCAQRLRPQFALTAAILPDVLRICRLVLGMPLGLELAAAWVEVLSPAEIAAQIARSADFLATDLRDAPDRHRSMRAVFEWSWRLLSADEQRVLRQLTVFRGAFTIAAAQTVAEAGLPALLRMVEKSLLRVDNGRYEIHDLLRQFAAEQLDGRERAAVQRRHSSYYLALAEEAATALAGPEQAAAMAQLSREHDNLRAALAFCLETSDVRLEAGDALRIPSLKPQASSLIEIGLRLAGALWPFWERYCHLNEGRRWLESLLQAEGVSTVAPEVRAMALIGAGCLAQDQDDYARANALFEAALSLERALGHNDGVTRVLAHRGVMVRAQGQYAQATALLVESLALARAADDRVGIAYVLRRLGGVLRERGEYARAADIYQECLATYRALGDRSGEGSVLLGLGDIARDQGDTATAEIYSTESLALGRELGQHWITGFALNNLAQAAIIRGDYAQAMPLAEEALELFRAQGIHGGVVELLITQGQIACAQGEYERARAALVEGVAESWTVGPHELAAAGMEELARVAAARKNAAQAVRLCAACSAWRETMDAPQQPYRRAAYETTLAAARQALGADGFAAAWAEGAAWRPEQAVAAALAEDNAPTLEQATAHGEDQPQPDLDEQTAASDPPPESPSASPPAPIHNLPSPLSSFVGREDELAHLAGLLERDVRLITVIGAGGAGKTRLALAAAWALREQFADRVWWVALAGVQPADDLALQRAALASAIATALGLALGGRRAPLEELADALRERAALLVLDNCEHLPEAAVVAHTLLEAVPSLRVLATSREPLGLAAETHLRLDGLRVPEDDAAEPAGYPGVRLFLERAVRHTPGWGQDTATMAATARLCRLLDGLPLAIELAAHWVGHYTPDEIAEAIQADLDFLAVRMRDVPDRHRSLRAVFDYAWDLLSPAEQQALARLSIFRGSFDRAAAQAVAGVRANTLATLVDKSLLRQAEVGRYSLHELLRQFAAERLLASGDGAAMRAQHAAYYLALVEQAMPELAGPHQATWLERLEQAFDNLRAALSWAQERGQTELALRLAGALERFWFTRGYLGEGREWLERFLTRAGAREVPPGVRAQAFSAAGLLANTQGDHVQATRWLERGLECYREADDLAGAVRALTTLGGVAYDQGDLRGALERWEQSLAQARAMGDLGEVARALGNTGEAEYHLGDLASAEAHHTEALALARQLGRANLEAFQLGDLGNVARGRGDLARATALHRQALEMKYALGARRQVAITLEDLAAVAGAEGRAERAARLLGAASVVREAIGTPQVVPERLATEQAVAAARAALGEPAWAAALAAGRALSLDQAFAYAMAETALAEDSRGA